MPNGELLIKPGFKRFGSECKGCEQYIYVAEQGRGEPWVECKYFPETPLYCDCNNCAGKEWDSECWHNPRRSEQCKAAELALMEFKDNNCKEKEKAE